jgi:hypothetical protein
MTRTLTTLAAATAIAVGAVASPMTAEARHFPAGPFIGGLAAGAILGAAIAPRYYGGYYEPYYAPAYYDDYGPSCVQRRERFWDGWGWRVRIVNDCY